MKSNSTIILNNKQTRVLGYMQIEVEKVENVCAAEMPEEVKRASNDLLHVATKGMMSWAEKNHKQKLIDILYRMGYYKYNQTIFLS